MDNFCPSLFYHCHPEIFNRQIMSRLFGLKYWSAWPKIFILQIVSRILGRKYWPASSAWFSRSRLSATCIIVLDPTTAKGARSHIQLSLEFSGVKFDVDLEFSGANANLYVEMPCSSSWARIWKSSIWTIFIREVVKKNWEKAVRLTAWVDPPQSG